MRQSFSVGRYGSMVSHAGRERCPSCECIDEARAVFSALLQQSKMFNTKTITQADVTPEQYRNVKPHIPYHHFLWQCTKDDISSNSFGI